MRSVGWAVFLLLCCWPGLSWAGSSTAVYRFELLDSSGERNNPDHIQWLEQVTQVFRQGMIEQGYDVVDLQPFAAEIEAQEPLNGCNGCFLPYSAKHGWDVSVFGVVRKVSTLIMGMQIMVFDSASERVLFHRTVSFRGDNWESWKRASQWIVRNHFHKLAQP